MCTQKHTFGNKQVAPCSPPHHRQCHVRLRPASATQKREFGNRTMLMLTVSKSENSQCFMHIHGSGNVTRHTMNANKRADCLFRARQKTLNAGCCRRCLISYISRNAAKCNESAQALSKLSLRYAANVLLSAVARTTCGKSSSLAILQAAATAPRSSF